MLKQIKHINLIVSLSLFLITFFSTNSDAQQDPIFNQYQFNTLVVNPAYAGSRELMSLMLVSRHQWVGFEGAPSTQSITLHSPIANRHIGLGITVLNDKIGPVNQLGAYVDYAFRFNLSSYTQMSLGLKGGLNHYKVDFNGLDKQSGYYDPAYENAIQTKMLPNFGFGFYIHSPRFYFGASAPKLLENQLGDKNSSSIALSGTETRHFFTLGGAIFSLNPNLKFKPSFMIRLSEASPMATDINMNFLYREKLWLGAMYRLKNAIGATLQYQFSQQFKIGYAFEMPTTEIQTYNNGTHEIMLNYELNFSKEKVQNPRYF
jgi:type IX secretion system PorP/SprF family membrane protein